MQRTESGDGRYGSDVVGYRALDMTQEMKKRNDGAQAMDARCVFEREIQMLEKLATLFCEVIVFATVCSTVTSLLVFVSVAYLLLFYFRCIQRD